jgi:hypothetical protein
VVRTFLEHLLATEGVKEEHRVVERPIGALIISIQAVSNLFGFASST